MSPLSRIAFIGNSLPRRCGIATFTTDLQQAIEASRTTLDTGIVAMTDKGRSYDYPPAVRYQVHENQIKDYIAAADFVNAGGYDVVSLQHEFGIFGGAAGGDIIPLLSTLTIPVVTTLHTVLVKPTPMQRHVLNRVIELSAKIIVMAEKGRELLRTVYGVPREKIEVIPHGIPDFPFIDSNAAKAKFGFNGKAVILTFGLLSPNKGIETVIDAMPAILKSRPDALYVVLGATHPNLVHDYGEAYRESLSTRVRDLGIEDHVVFFDQFADQATLLDFISMCDVYVTPYLNEEQMTSGTLAYSFGLGKAVVSTPYWHAQELLAEGRGILVPFGDSEAIGREVSGLLTDDARRFAIGKAAHVVGRSMIWEQIADRYLTVFEQAQRGYRLRVVHAADHHHNTLESPPELKIGHFLAMCDDTGLFQHAVCSVPDRSHGYCVDDNARALLLACALDKPGEQPLSETMTSSFCAFIQHAWNPDTKRFRNFMGFNRQWLEPSGSEDSHGRTLWALGECAKNDTSPARQLWAASLFEKALPVVENFGSPRAWAFTLLGLDAYCAAAPTITAVERLRVLLADRLASLLSTASAADWMWFEDELSYDNARLSQALIITGTSMKNPAYLEAGLKSLRWLMSMETTLRGVFRPVGTESFGKRRERPLPFDQQPLEATAAISACLAAWRANGAIEWHAHAARAFAWFFGENDLRSSLIDLETGSCRDGLHPDRPNENRGGESVVSYLLSVAEIRQIASVTEHRVKSGLRLAEVGTP